MTQVRTVIILALVAALAYGWTQVTRHVRIWMTSRDMHDLERRQQQSAALGRCTRR